MISAMDKGDDVDRVLLGWIVVWSIAFSIALAGLSQRLSLRYDQGINEAILGFAAGGLLAAWITAGTWALLIDLPRWRDDTGQAGKQRWSVRIGVVLFCALDALIVAESIGPALDLVYVLLVATLLSIAGPTIVWQWTNRRIQRGKPSVPNHRSIRQMLGLTALIATLIALLKFFQSPMLVNLTAFMIAVLWLILLLVMLGRWWMLIVVSIPIVILEWFLLSMTIVAQGRIAEPQVIGACATILGFYLFALLFLAQARSSGHRWNVGRPLWRR